MAHPRVEDRECPAHHALGLAFVGHFMPLEQHPIDVLQVVDRPEHVGLMRYHATLIEDSGTPVNAASL